MPVEIQIGTPLANSLNLAIQGKITELGWASQGAEADAMSEYFLLLLSSGKNQEEITAETPDLLGPGINHQDAPVFAQWMFEQVELLNGQMSEEKAQSGPQPGPQSGPQSSDMQKDDAMDASYDAVMDLSGDGLTTEQNPPTGPKAMRSGAPRGGREKRIMGQINRTLERNGDALLHRVRSQSGNERISRNPPSGPRMGGGRQARNANNRAAHFAVGLAHAGGLPVAPTMNPMGPLNASATFDSMNGLSGGMNSGLNTGFVPPEIVNLMTEQNRMLQQMQQQLMMQQQQQQQQQQNGGHGGNGKSLFDRASRGGHGRRGGAQQQHNGHGFYPNPAAEAAKPETEGLMDDVDMLQGKAGAEETICKFNKFCTNRDCKFAHQSPAAPPGITMDVTDSCTFGAACKNRKCVGRHPSPATRMAHQSEQDCKFFPNCQNPACPFRHPTMPPCRNGGECKVPNCKFTHVKTACKFRPCTNRFCPFTHEEGQRGVFQDKVWTADDGHVSERKFVKDDGLEDVVLPGSEEAKQEAGIQEVIF